MSGPGSLATGGFEGEQDEPAPSLSTTSGLDPAQLLRYVVQPALEALGLPGGVLAEKLVMGTAAQESGFKYLHQLGKGPALSLWQIEPTTAMDTLRRAPAGVLDRLDTMVPGVLHLQSAGLLLGPLIDQLAGNLYLGAAMCRLVYYMKPFEMPSPNAVGTPQLERKWCAAIWKRFYNSMKGAGTEPQFLANWKKFKLDNLWKGVF
jgi:hypothetical protein